jgi:serine/threonine protein kinase
MALAQPAVAALTISIKSPKKRELDVCYNDMIGSGHFAKVYKSSIRGIVIKVLEKQIVMRNTSDPLHEISIHSSLNHPNIVKFLGYKVDKTNYYFSLEECDGNLECYRRELPLGIFQEHDLKKIMFQLLKALEYLYAFNICHRDIKPENLLYISKENELVIKLCDFGLANYPCSPGAIIGTPVFLAPENVLKKSHTPAVDIWSSAITMYCLGVGIDPWDTDCYKVCMKQITSITAEIFEKRLPQNWNMECKKFICRMIVQDPAERPIASALLDDEWFKPIQ